MTLFADITFLQVCLALLAVGATERVLLRFGAEPLVGPEGWLIRTPSE